VELRQISGIRGEAQTRVNDGTGAVCDGTVEDQEFGVVAFR
jgi:hypothetical protein